MCSLAKGSLPEEKLLPIRQVWCHFPHALAEESQVLVELFVIEGTKGNAYGILVNGDQTWQLEEGEKSPPGSMSIGLREMMVTSPHDKIGQRELENGHDVIFAIIEFIHRPLSRGQIL